MPKITTIFWRDIPAQVIGQQGRTRHKQELPKRFAHAINRAAMRAGRSSSDAYLEDWRREHKSVDGELKTLVNAEVSGLEARFPEDVLERVTKAGGIIETEH